MAALVKYPCSGELHDLVFTNEGDLIPLDHDIEEELAAVAIGADAPPCIEVLSAWTGDVASSIDSFMLWSGALPPGAVVDLAIASAHHVLPIWEDALEGDTRPRELLEIASKLRSGEVTTDDVTDDFSALVGSLMPFNKRKDPRESVAADMASHAAREAARASWELALARERLAGAAPLSRSDASTVARRASGALISARRAAIVHSSDVGPREARADFHGRAEALERETDWQMRQFVKILQRIRPLPGWEDE